MHVFYSLFAYFVTCTYSIPTSVRFDLFVYRHLNPLTPNDVLGATVISSTCFRHHNMCKKWKPQGDTPLNYICATTLQSPGATKNRWLFKH